MKKIKNYLKTGILLIGILTTMTNCQKEDLFNTQTLQQTSQKQNQAITSFQNNFSLDNFKDDFVRNNLVIKWDEFIVTENPDSSLSYEFLTNLNATVSFKNPKNNLNSKYKLIVTISENNYIDFEIVKFLGKNKNLLKDIGLKYLNGFNGATYHYNLNGDLIKSEGFDKGKFVNTMKNKSASLNNVAERAPVEEGWVLVLTERYTDWFFNRGTSYSYSTSHLESRSLEYVYIGSNSGNYNMDSAAHEHYPHTPSPSIPVDIHPDEIIIDSTFSNLPKINCTLEQLLKTNSMKEILVDFFGTDALYDLKFQVVDNCNTNNDVNGCAENNLNLDGSVTISIFRGSINSSENPTLFLAKTIVHEAIHANIYAQVKKLNNEVTPSNNDFAILYEEYRQKKNWSHEYMANKYLTTISKTLRAVHPLLGDQTFIDDRNTFPNWDWDKFYKEISWLGLYNTVEGQIHLQNPDYGIDSNIYVNGAKTDSTIIPKCD